MVLQRHVLYSGTGLVFMLVFSSPIVLGFVTQTWQPEPKLNFRCSDTTRACIANISAQSSHQVLLLLTHFSQ